MKLFFAIAFLAILGCNTANKTETVSMPGAYKMLSQTITLDNKDSTNSGSQQMKIYTEDHMMYAKFNPADSSSSFGVASYSVSKDTTFEDAKYFGWAGGMSDSAATYKLTITKTDKGYQQVIPNIEMNGKKYVLKEDYEKVGSEVKSPLDGLWKLTSSYSLMGKDSFPENKTQYKIYCGGYFIFGLTYTDSTNKINSGMGYGKFAMTGTNKSKESVLVSSYSEVIGKDIDISIEMSGTDAYTQSFTSKDGYKAVEHYQRVKK